MFNDEKELRKALFKEKLLEHRYSGSNLSIRLLRNGKYYKVMYDFLYQKDIDFSVPTRIYLSLFPVTMPRANVLFLRVSYSIE